MPPHRKPDPDEPRYTISVAARLVQLHPQTLRHYERIGLVEPARSPGRMRLYSQRDIERLQKITRLVDELGVNLAGVEVILKMTQQIEALQAQVDEIQSRHEVEIERVRRAYLEDQMRHRPQLPKKSSWRGNQEP